MGAGAGFTLGRLAEVLGATLDEHPERLMTGVATLASAGPADVAFVADRRHLEAARIWRAEDKLPELIRSLERVQERLQALETLGACRSIEECHGFDAALRALGGMGGHVGAPHVLVANPGGARE